MSLSQSKRILRTGTHLFHEEARICYAALGPRGIFYSSTSWAFGHPAEITVPVEGIKHPVHIRMRTSDAGVFEDALVKKEYEYPVSFLPRTIIDVGANCGMTTIFYANRYPNATIVAVEPEESNYAALIKNTQSYANVVPLHAALWNSDGQVEVFPGWPRWESWGKWGFRVRTGIGCRAMTLPTLMREVGIETVDILKIDVEGAEREIFHIATGCIESSY